MERIFLAVIVSALMVLIGSATMLVYGARESAALLRLPAQEQTPAKPSPLAVLPLGAAAARHR
ncbi:hypothetical protein [Bradyrhizobium icense]|uniref:Uncharacterized protein n=1 Tax=Bradyrhizobium icense TaxID=1274631 RepID=A0A1B1U8Z3_9BRAD|nr:hypothetical protein [Bradyrhizobium icense]ANV99247.1 hypothetical protein LMTR13_02690 [Bradyrhizobium icense]